jgi:hypothetical protein
MMCFLYEPCFAMHVEFTITGLMVHSMIWGKSRSDIGSSYAIRFYRSLFPHPVEKLVEK